MGTGVIVILDRVQVEQDLTIATAGPRRSRGAGMNFRASNESRRMNSMPVPTTEADLVRGALA